VLKLLRGRLDDLAELIDADPALVNRRFSELDCGMSGGRSLTLQGGTLLHVAAEYGNLAALALLLDYGADVNARATVDDAGASGQTAIFHAVTQFDDDGLGSFCGSGGIVLNKEWTRLCLRRERLKTNHCVLS
jgi:ankyrin repeat protein